MNESIRNAARSILQSMRRAYGAPLTRVPAREADFPHLDLAAYRRFAADMQARGYVFLYDYAVREINESPTSLIAPTLLRAYASPDGAIVATCYQRSARWDRLRAKLWQGLLNGRWIDAPKMFFRAGRTLHCIEFSSSFADGFVSTSNAQGAESIGMPASLDRKFFPYGTPLSVLLAEHQARLAAAAQRRGGQAPVPVRGVGELLVHADRESQIKSAHRAAIGWVTREELLKLSGNKPQLADAIYAEVRALLREEGQGA